MDINAELEILREFIDFTNQQVGVYSDACGAFAGTKIRIERQIHRENFLTKQKNNPDGTKTMVWNCVEDPNKPEPIISRIIRAPDHIAANSETGVNERYTVWGIIVFLFVYWNEDVRPRIARVRGVELNDIQVDALGDIRILRNSIIHNKGNLQASEYAKLKVLTSLVQPDALIALSHDQMHSLFVAVKSAIGDIVLEKTGHLPGAPKPGEIKDIAIQNVRPREAQED
jgi:hypothetical protein